MSIHYRFKTEASQWRQISFDGSGISVADLKQRIVSARKLIGSEFTLLFHDAQTQAGKSGGFENPDLLMHFRILRLKCFPCRV